MDDIVLNIRKLMEICDVMTEALRAIAVADISVAGQAQAQIIAVEALAESAKLALSIHVPQPAEEVKNAAA